MRKNFCTTLFISFLIMMSGCSGCSESALQHRAEQQREAIKNAERNPSGQRTSPVKVQTPNVQTPSVRVQTPNAQTSSVGNARTLSELFVQNRSAVFMIYTSDDETTYQGSGFFVTSEGIAVSNYHVFEGTLIGNEEIITESGDVFKIDRVLENNKELDYIIFKVRGIHNADYLKLSRVLSPIGEDVFAITNPIGLSHTLSTGIVSGYRENNSMIQTSAEITHGSSGGALMNMEGEVIGITTGGFKEANLNFAINIQELRLERFVHVPQR